MLPEKDSISNATSLSPKIRQLNLQQRYESLIILPQEDTPDSSNSSCKNCTCNQINQNSTLDDVPPLQTEQNVLTQIPDNSILDEVPPLQTEQNVLTQITENIQEDPNKKIINDIQKELEKEIARENKEQQEESKELQEENKNTNLLESNINQELKNQKECIIL